MALGYQNPFYLKQAQQKQQSLYNGKVLLEKHDPPAMYDSDETLQLAQERVFVSQKAKSREELYFSNILKTASVFKSISIPNEEFSDDTTLEAAKFVRDFKSLAKEADESLAEHKALELEIERLLRGVVNQDIMSIVQKRLQAQFGDLKGKSKDTPCVSDTLDPLSRKQENENVELEFQVSEQKDTTKGTSANTKFANQSSLGKPLLQPLRNHFVIRQPNAFQSERPKRVPPKVAETNDLLNPVTLNSVPTATESTVMTNDKVIAPGMFKSNPFKTSREDKFVPINKVRASVRINPITVS
ncbi:hypothetical protein Tco_0864814 [Tanacetum coccineum]